MKINLTFELDGIADGDLDGSDIAEAVDDQLTGVDLEIDDDDGGTYVVGVRSVEYQP